MSFSPFSDGLAGELYDSSVFILSTFSFVVTSELVWMETPDLVSSFKSELISCPEFFFIVPSYR